MSQTNWFDSLLVGNEGEKVAEDLFDFIKNKKQIKDWTRTPHYTFEHHGLDYEYDYLFVIDKKRKGIEVKCLAGEDDDGIRYASAVIEVWKDNDRTVRPGWWKSQEAGVLNFVYIVNRRDRKIYCFSSTVLYNWINSQTHLFLTRCRNKNTSNKGWITLFKWEDEAAGWRGTWTKEEDGWIIKKP
jgi:hypothetical protein